MTEKANAAADRPASNAAEQTANVTARSPLEVFVAGLQSIGSWTGFLGYAVAGGVVVWLGLTTNTVYLLIGAMLMAPFAGPAINRGGRLASWLTTAGALVMLLTVQFATSRPTLEHASVAQEIRDAVLVILAADSNVAVVEANLRFTRATIRGQNTLLAVLYVQRNPRTTDGDDVLRERISALVRHTIASRAPEVTPLAGVTILTP